MRGETYKHAGGTIHAPNKTPNTKLTDEQVVYIRDNPDGLNAYELAAKFGVDETTINAIQLGKTHKSAGGIIRGLKRSRIPDDVRAEIRKLYKRDVRGCGYGALAKRFGISAHAVFNIVNE